MSILITGGAGFVGASLALNYRENNPSRRIVAFDNLKRRGSELNLPRFRDAGIEFIHGDVREPADLEAIPGEFDLVIDAAAEPSVHAGGTGDPRYVIDTNLGGTLNTLEYVRKRGGGFIFLSTSRVYSIPALRNMMCLKEEETRFRVMLDWLPGGGISEHFDTTGFRSLYGSTKLASELFVQEYCQTYNLAAVINRCGTLAGPGQWGKTDQGIFTLWVAHHLFGLPLRYTGFGGTGKQVRDLLHPYDLYRLLVKQEAHLCDEPAVIYNVGGGMENSTSLLEYTALCQETTGRHIDIDADPVTNPVDVPYYVSDISKVANAFGWQPELSLPEIVATIHGWLQSNREQLEPMFREGAGA